jgi:hypothetical protein
MGGYRRRSRPDRTGRARQSPIANAARAGPWLRNSSRSRFTSGDIAMIACTAAESSADSPKPSRWSSRNSTPWCARVRECTWRLASVEVEKWCNEPDHGDHGPENEDRSQHVGSQPGTVRKGAGTPPSTLPPEGIRPHAPLGILLELPDDIPLAISLRRHSRSVGRPVVLQAFANVPGGRPSAIGQPVGS